MDIKAGPLAATIAAFTAMVLSMLAAAWPGPARGGDSILGGRDFPREELKYKARHEVQDAVMARKTGEVAVSTNEEVLYFSGGKDPAWTAGGGRGWKLVQDLGIGWDGKTVFFQTDRKPKTTTEGKELTLHFYDGAGKEVFTAPNPGRYKFGSLSPSGRYLLLGYATHPGVECYAPGLKKMWTKDIKYWHLAFDPLERYFFDGEGGKLYKVTGEEEWDFGSRTKINSISDDALVLMTQHYRTVKEGGRIFVIGREALKKVELAGSGGCVSPDGSICAYITDKGKLRVHKTGDIFGGARESAAPIFETDFIKPWSMNISRDNRSLFVMGKESNSASSMLLIDLVSGELSWRKKVSDKLRKAAATEDNRFVLIQPEDSIVIKYACY